MQYLQLKNTGCNKEPVLYGFVIHKWRISLCYVMLTVFFSQNYDFLDPQSFSESKEGNTQRRRSTLKAYGVYIL